MTMNTLKSIKTFFPKTILLNWFFDIYIEEKPIWETPSFFQVIELYDYFLCSLTGVANKLKEKGLTNVYTVKEACDQYVNSPQYLNNFQRKKYDTDVLFIGTIGYHNIHKNRIELLTKLINNGFNIKIYGDIIGNVKLIPKELLNLPVYSKIINEAHSIAVQVANITLGMDSDDTIYEGYSARLFRVLCAGGFYLTNYIPGIENLFKINKEINQITEDQDLAVYYNHDDLIKKLDFLLEHDKLRHQIAENGRKKVLSQHKFVDRVKEIEKIINR